MSNVSTSTDVIAILCSDLHLSHTAPPFRANEENWYMKQAAVLQELYDLHQEHSCPVIMAGDVFEKWLVVPELINLAIEDFPPDVYAIPGQHDLPYHDISQIRKSAYWTLVAAGTIQSLFPIPTVVDTDPPLILYGIPWGQPIPPARHNIKGFHIAVGHKLVYDKTHRPFGTVPEENEAHIIQKQLEDFDFAVYGDNHRNFYYPKKKNQLPAIYNCGTMLRRKANEREYTPTVGLLKKDLSVTSFKLNTKDDVYTEITEEEENVTTPIDLDSFVKELSDLEGTTEDFRDEVNYFIEKHKNIRKRVKQIILESLDDGDK